MSDILRQAATEVLPATAPREQWLVERRKGIGSSDIAAIMGVSSYESPFSLWHRKFGDLGDQPDNDQMRWGRRLEEAIAQEYAYQHPETTVTKAGLWRNNERPWQMCSPDRFVYFGEPTLAVLEVKTDGSYEHWGRDGSDEIPVHYRAQVLWQLDTLGLEKAIVAVLISGHTYREYELHYDAGDAAFLRKAAEAFIQRKEPPPIDDSVATTDALRIVIPLLDDEDVKIPKTLAADYERAVRSYNAAERRKILATNRIRRAIGGHKRAVYDGRTMAVRSRYDEHRIDITALKREHPELAELYSTKSTVDKITPGRGLAK